MSATVSVLCPSFNHEKYMKFFLDSLLAQTNPNWELIIVDDCSTDNNVAEIKKYKDKRIKLIENPFNMGINCGLNNAFKYAKGEYVCFSASDDILLPEYVDNIIKTFENNPDKGIVYCNLQQIDENNNILKNDILFNQQDDRYKTLKTLFMFGNTMMSPGMAIRKSLFKQIMPLDIPVAHNQDYKIHIDLILKSDFVVMDKISVLYRKPSKKSGLSVFNDVTNRARQLEENILMNSFLQIKDVKTLKNIFGDDLNQFGKIDKNLIPYVLGVMAMQSNVEYKQIWGYNQIVSFLMNAENYELLHKKYGFCYRDFLNLAKKFSVTPDRKKYLKYKKLFNISAGITFILLIIILFLI